MNLRILASIILAFSVLFLPFWISVLVALWAFFSFSFFYEAVGIFLLSDLLYGVKEQKFYGFLFVSAIIALIVILLLELLKKKLKFYQ